MPDFRLAYFARGLDGLFLPEVPGCEAFALLRADSPEESWSGRFVPPDRSILYRLRGHADDPYPATGDVLHDSDVARVLAKRRIGALLLSSSFNPQIRAWSERHGVRVLAADYALRRRLEDKLWFDRFLARHEIPRPASGVVVVGRSPANRSGLSAGPVVVQAADSQGGEGTYFLESQYEWLALAQRLHLPHGQRLLVRRFVAGQPLGITVFVAPGQVALSAVRLQCYYPSASGEARRLFAGIQWSPSSDLSSQLRSRIGDVFQRLGGLLYRRRFFGVANFDFLADEQDRVWVIECNPRMSAATPQLLANLELSGGFPLGRQLLEGYRQPRRWPTRYDVSPLPRSKFAGATLDITSQDPAQPLVSREFASGPIRSAGGMATLFSLAARGQTATPETTLGIVLADYRLYDVAGNLNAAGRELFRRFRYT
jgi:hypothetical protein